MPPKNKNTQQNSNTEVSQVTSKIQFAEQDPQISKILQKSELTPQNSILLQSICEYFEIKLARKDEILNETLCEVKKMQIELQRVEKMNKKIQDLVETVETLKSKIDNNEQYERLDIIIMSGTVPVVHPDENRINVVRYILHERNLNINSSDISIAHRIGKKPASGSDDKRNIIFKLTRRDLIKDIKNACKQGTPNVYVNESLTPTRNKIHYVLRKMKKNHRNHMGGINTHNGNVCVWMPVDDETSLQGTQMNNRNFRRIIVNTKKQLDSFLQRYFKCDSSEFIAEWP